MRTPSYVLDDVHLSSDQGRIVERMKVREDHIRELLDTHGELSADEMCDLLGVDRANVSFPLRLMLQSGEVVMRKQGGVRDSLPSHFSLAPKVPQRDDRDPITGLLIVRRS